MVRKCVAYGCSASHQDGVSLHEWPKDPHISRLWTKFVQTKRANWTNTASSTICSRHFDPVAFDVNPIRASLGFPTKKPKLLPGACPTIHVCALSGKENSTPKRKRLAYEKRKRSRILEELLQESESASADVHHNEEGFQAVEMQDNPEPAQTWREIGTDPRPATTTDRAVTVKPQTRTVRVQARSKGHSKGLQVSPKTQDSSVQCELLKVPVTSSPLTSDDEDMDCDSTKDYDDPSYHPDSDLDSDEDLCSNSESFMDYELANQEVKFVVFVNMLMQLFKLCHLCGRSGAKATYSVLGTLITVTQSCLFCDRSYKWQSQTFIGNIPEGNILLSAAILFSGATPSKVLRLLRFWGVSAISSSTFFSHQKNFLTQTIRNVWSAHQEELLKTSPRGEVIVGGDGRCDSMGHCAKYGSYGLMDLHRNKILALELVQSNETGGSYGMELEGLQRCLKHLDNFKVKVKTIVTDRHPQIKKWLRENCPNVVHYFDIWHVAKGLKKKLLALGKKKGFGLITEWTRSIVNHLYWSAVSSDGNGEEAVAKWNSVANHIANIHYGHSDIFPECMHPPIEGSKEWFNPGSEEYEQLTEILESAYLRKDVMKLSPIGQTSSIEGYHSVVNHFAPKMYHFGYDGMRNRLRLAALHFNENSNRAQATNKSGSLMYSISFPKAKQGQHTVKKIMTECTFAYVDHLFEVLRDVCLDATTNRQLTDREAPPSLSNRFKKPDKDTAIRELFSRFPSKTK